MAAFYDDDDDLLDGLDVDAIVAEHNAKKISSPPAAQQAAPTPVTVSQMARRAICPPDLTVPLNKYFGHDQFREGQDDAVRAALEGRDVCIYWPTGRGKSVCYQLPALIADRVTIVVSPLVSLMMDQCARLNHTVSTLGTDAPSSGGRVEAAIFLGPHQKDKAAEERALRGDGARLIYVSPEKLFCGVLERLAALRAKGQLLLIAIDEAHW